MIVSVLVTVLQLVNMWWSRTSKALIKKFSRVHFDSPSTTSTTENTKFAARGLICCVS